MTTPSRRKKQDTADSVSTPSLQILKHPPLDSETDGEVKTRKTWERQYHKPLWALLAIVLCVMMWYVILKRGQLRKEESVKAKKLLVVPSRMEKENNDMKVLETSKEKIRMVITLATGVKSDRIYLLMASFRKHHPDVNKYKMYLFTEQNPKELFEEYKRLSDHFGINLVDIGPIENKLNNIYLSQFEKKIQFVKLNKRRFFIFDYWLSQMVNETINSDTIDAIFVTDANDVKFQGNIFELVDKTFIKNPHLNRIEDEIFWFFMESSNIKMDNEKWNIRYIKYCFGNETVKLKYHDKPVSCSGTSLATFNAIKWYFHTMVDIITTQGKQTDLFPECLIKPGDQGIHNTILHDHLLEIKYSNIFTIQVPNDAGWVLQITTMINNDLYKHRVVQMANDAAVVHQWKWAHTLAQKYIQEEYNYVIFPKKIFFFKKPKKKKKTTNMSSEYRPSYRDLTKRYMHLRDSFRPVGIPMNEDNQSHNQNQKLLPLSVHESSSHESQGEGLHSLPPVWVETLEAIDYDLQKIEQQINLLQTYHSKRLRISFDETKEQDAQIQETTRSITSLFRDVQIKLKKVALMGNENESNINEDDDEEKKKKKKKKKDYLIKKELDFLEKLSKQESRGNRLIDEDINSTLPSFDRLEQGFTREQLLQLEQVERDSSQRTRDIIAIAKSVNELAQLFNELSVLVVEQGSLLDRIDYNVEQTVNNIRSAQDEIIKAEKHQKASRSVLCIIILILLIFVGVIILIVRNLPSK
ncbi:hypothetical protein RFI_12825 [Reticulomyxa filosa]|uniref:t-SNARE coiled-coil homology domain-containing protein n=1 Tax=Reticulomyxa filosa TaxID=46433 RepID=X6NG67_RETFI|nr:hypothetical protein RFI_12825 [Reticulomyxa filosa]|eukprot:ETO24332.1 hypothetical protein RFI_12825 [Reticulomyxa filosa]